MSHLMLLTKTSETPLTETLESATEMLQTSVSGAAAGGVGRISWVIMILLTFLTLLSVIVLTLLQIKIWKQQQALHERTWKRQQTLYGMLNKISGQLQCMENGRYGYRESVSSPISHADFIEKAPDRNSEWQKQKEDDDYFLDEEEDIQEENRDFGNEDTMNRYVHPTLELKRQNMQRLSCSWFPQIHIQVEKTKNTEKISCIQTSLANSVYDWKKMQPELKNITLERSAVSKTAEQTKQNVQTRANEQSAKNIQTNRKAAESSDQNVSQSFRRASENAEKTASEPVRLNPRFCKFCGAQLKKGTEKFCPLCGKSLYRK